jgi:hypothetical protein
MTVDWETINITKFNALNSEIASELSSEEVAEARDILNHRVEKIGKLYSRNGYIFGLNVGNWKPDQIISCTFDGDTVTTNVEHGLIEGSQVIFLTVVTTTEVTDSTPYIVKNATPLTFELNNGSGGVFTYTAGSGTFSQFLPQIRSFLKNSGLIGLKEYVSSEFLPNLDTDRFMIYFIRGEEATGDYRNKLCILLAPMTGKYKNWLLLHSYDNWSTGGWNDYADVCSDREQNPQDEGILKTLYAPNREIPTDGVTNPHKEDGTDNGNWDGLSNNYWIEQYIDTEQFKRKLLIADRVNGNLILEDEYDLVEDSQEAKPDHKLRIRPAFKEAFNIDIITLDSRRDFENSEVKNGMALYGYKLDKSYMKGTVSYADNKISNPDWLGDIKQAQFGTNHSILDKVLNYFTATNTPNTFMSAVDFFCLDSDNSNLDGGHVGFLLRINRQKDYIFTDAEIPGQEYQDVLKPLILEETKTVNDKGQYIKEKVANIYIWHDNEITYYPVTATGNGDEFLTDALRIFDKLSGGARGIELKVQDKYGRQVPLGVWGYRYVWDFGGGEYSAPSTPIICPDQLFSAVNDADAGEENGSLTPPFVRRTEFAGLNRLRKQVGQDTYPEPTGNDFTTAAMPNTYFPVQIYNTPGIKYGKLVSASQAANEIHLTGLGKKFYQLKEKLYKGKNNKYGLGNWSQLTDVDGLAITPDNLNLLGNFCTLITADYGVGNRITKNGNIFEGIVIPYDSSWDKGYYLDSWDSTQWWSLYWDQVIHITSQPLTIPIFQDINDVRTYNSLFDDGGRLRLAYLEQPNINNRPQFQLIMRLNYLEGKSNNSLFVNIAQIPPDDYNQIILNIITQKGTTDFDLNNKEAGVYSGNNLRDIRPNTILRAVKSDNDKLNNYNSEVDSEAFNRLVLTGHSGIDIVKNGDKIYGHNFYDSQHIYIKTLEQEVLAYTKPRDYDIDSKLLLKTSGLNSNQGIYTMYNTLTFADQSTTPIDNLEVTLYGEAQRFIGIEQLTSYFPSSLLTESPRMGIKIPNSKIPKRAKKLLIYRTLCSHNNNFDPNMYGLVEAVDIARDENKVVDMKDNLGNSTGGFYYFDKIRDSALDFQAIPSEYDGITMNEDGSMPVKPRFNTKVGERPVMANFVQEYQPPSPRGFKDGNFDGEFVFYGGVTSINMMSLDVGYQVINADQGEGFES